MKKVIINNKTVINRENIGHDASRGEMRVAFLCKKLDLTFQTESEYELSKNKKCRYDFEGFVCDDKRVIIEVMGSQHFNEPDDPTWGPLAKIQLKDAEKLQYALNVLKAKVIYINMREADYTKYTDDYIRQHLTVEKLASALLAEGPIQNIELDE